MERASGVLMPISSLPGPYGIGGFGWNAYDFVDFLASCKQHYWQILPLTTTSYGDSPYQSFSAARATLTSLTLPSLSSRLSGTARYRRRVPGSDPSNIDYGAIFAGRRQILDRAAERFAADKPADFDDFIQANENWLIPYCEFMTVKEECGSRPFGSGPRNSAVAAMHPARSAPPSRAHALPPNDAVLLRSPVEPPQGLCQRARHPDHRRPAHLRLARLRRDVGHT